MSVEDYHKEMEIAMMHTNVAEHREDTMVQFLSGLNKEIANIIELHHYVELKDMVDMDMKVKRQLRKKTHLRSYFGDTWYIKMVQKGR